MLDTKIKVDVIKNMGDMVGLMVSEAELHRVSDAAATQNIFHMNDDTKTSPTLEEQKIIADAIYCALFVVSEKLFYADGFIDSSFDKYFEGARDTAEINCKHRLPEVNCCEAVYRPLNQLYMGLKESVKETINKQKIKAQVER